MLLKKRQFNGYEEAVLAFDSQSESLFYSALAQSRVPSYAIDIGAVLTQMTGKADEVAVTYMSEKLTQTQ